ncbi:type III-B CRISPR-associated protein Cas10/Cmr2 [Caminibacter pacificus]|uniref:CRISPR-associated Cmr2 family protein n=1 Tax=Caminibacter pacificus TaxID=1424653 RepID=A0AAJ4RAV6_9BACT|nr:type III-B CRISPR-associated protein Cas10/Cmr2 [Caminibacter pacificus]QCI28747.1 type III-B CRISPR-associated protein Cas10/Cmr2 [Caminibacter pacificus]ROR37188.1 CRISPR-associated Cmr2 family protein [Caminibacter pacificus]
MRYAGITIGPIYKTLLKARKTKELWAASYIFSFIMREIAKRFKDKKFILPYVADEVFEIKNVGLFNDRMIFEVDGVEEEDINKAIDEAIKKLSEMTGIDRDYLKEYIQIEYVIENVDNGNLVDEMYKYLDTKELFFQTPTKDKFKDFFKNVNNTKLAKFAFGRKHNSFTSLLEIALADVIDDDLREIVRQNDEKDINIFEDEDLNKKYNFQDYHKYVAIVQVDGDNMGKVNKLLDNASIEDYEKLSKDLFYFVKQALNRIKDFGGFVVYAGGDDLLFFAPIKNRDKNILDLAFELDEIYQENMKSWNDRLENTKTTLSFGINISYYKFPMYEALKNAQNLLFNKAKKTKNAIAIDVIKHSGQVFNAVIKKENVETIKALLNNDFKFDTSIIYKIDTYKKVLELLNEKDRFEAFFKNYFNENYSKNKDFYNLLAQTMYKLKTSNYPEDLNLKVIYFILRFNNFIRTNDDKTNNS